MVNNQMCHFLCNDGRNYYETIMPTNLGEIDSDQLDVKSENKTKFINSPEKV